MPLRAYVWRSGLIRSEDNRSDGVQLSAKVKKKKGNKTPGLEELSLPVLIGWISSSCKALHMCSRLHLLYSRSEGKLHLDQGRFRLAVSLH